MSFHVNEIVISLQIHIRNDLAETKYHSYRIFNVVCVQIILMSLEIGILTVAIYKQLLIQPTQFREGHKGR